MAFSWNGRQLIITSADAAKVHNARMYVKDIYWYDPTNIGDTVVIKERDGDLYKTLRCEVAGESQFMTIENWIDGLIVDTLVSGVLYINVA